MRTSLRIALLACACGAAWSGVARAATYYVSPAGSDGAAGTSPAAAWATVAKVNARTFQPGDSVLFAAGGVWHEMLSPRGNGTTAAPITFGAYGEGRAVLDGAGAPQSAYAGIELGRSYLVVRDLELRNWNGPLVYVAGGTGVTLSNIYGHHADEGIHPTPSAASSAFTVERSVIASIGDGPAGSAINLPPSASDWVVRDTEISGAADSCVIDQGARSQYLRVRVHGCGFGGYTYGTHGLYLKGPGQSLRDSEIYTAEDSCVSVRFQDAVVSGNRIHGCLEGISWYEYATAQGSVSLTRNRIWDTGTGIYLDGSPTQRFLISNNTILGGRVAGGASIGISARTSRGLSIENTIVAGALSTALAAGPMGAAGYRERANVFAADGTLRFSWNGNDSTFTAYRAASGQGAGSRAADPLLAAANPVAPDLALRVGSPAIDAGVADPATGALAAGCDGAALRYCGSAPDAGAVELLLAAPIGAGSPGTITPPPPTAGGPVPVSGPAPAAVLPATGGEKGASRRRAPSRQAAPRRAARHPRGAGDPGAARGHGLPAARRRAHRARAWRPARLRQGPAAGRALRFRIELVTADGRRVSETLGVKTPRAARHAQPRPAR